MLVEVGNEVFPGLRSDEIHPGTPECSAGRAAFACVRETYICCGRAMRQAAEVEIAPANTGVHCEAGMAFARVREHIYVAGGRDLLFGLSDLL